MTRRYLLVFLALLGAAVVAPPAPAQPRADKQQPPSVSADGTEVFQFLLDAAKIRPIRVKDLEHIRQMNDVIVIVLGRSNELIGHNFPLDWARMALTDGGAALIASDNHTAFAPKFSSARSEAKQGDTAITGAMVVGTAPKNCFQGRENMPFIEPRDRPIGGGPEWSLFEGLERIASNQPSVLSVPHPRGEFQSVLAGFSADCRVGIPPRKLHPQSEVFAVGASGSHPTSLQHYRSLILADPSVFINEMMLPVATGEPKDNFEFARRVVAYLSEAGPVKRRRCLLIQNGQVVERFDALRPLMQPPLPRINLWDNQDKIVDIADKVVDHVQTHDIPNKLILGQEESQREGRFKYYVAVLLAMLAIRAGWYLMKRLFMVRRRAGGAPAAPGGLPLFAEGERPVGVFDRRQRELLRRNNVYEPVHLLLCDLFAAAGMAPEPGQKLPAVRIAETVGRPGTLRAALADLWKIAAGPPRVLTVQRWRVLEPICDRVRQAHADGKWAFQVPRG